MDNPCIYIMYWNVCCPYIGQTVHLLKRKNAHFNSLSNLKHVNYKIQNAYNTTNTFPNIEVLEYCTHDNMNPLEESYIKEFDSINNGLNIISGGYSVGYGVNNPASLYTEEQLVEVLVLLSDVNNSYKIITEKTSVGKDTITKIASGVHHLWLKEKYPVLYQNMKSVDSKLRYKQSASAGSQNKKYRKILDPNGIVHEVTNTLEFSKKYDLPNGNLCSVLLGRRNSVKGWKGID